jgi:hypothetical protein
MEERKKSQALTYVACVFGVLIVISIGLYVSGYFFLTEVELAKGVRYRIFSRPRTVWIYGPMLSIESLITGVQTKASMGRVLTPPEFQHRRVVIPRTKKPR